MREQKTDLWTIAADARCITTNGVLKSNGSLVMGAGVALEAMKRYPDIGERLGKHVAANGNIPCYLDDIGIISFPTKHNWRHNSILPLIATSANHLVRIADTHKLTTIALPRPGCGLGGFQWPNVIGILSSILDDRFIVVY